MLNIFYLIVTKNERIFAGLVILAVLTINLAFGLPRLSRYGAVDEPYWTYSRTPKFWSSIVNHKWKSTNINNKPGVTSAIISGAGLLSVDPLQYRSIRQKPKSPELISEYQNLNFQMRLPIFLFTLLMLPVFYFLLKKLLNWQIGLFSVIFIGLSPILLGISLIINPDSLLWIFAPLSIISYFVFQKEKKPFYLYLSGVLLGLSLLTKYVSNILLVFYLGLIFLEYILDRDEKIPVRDYLRKSLLDFAKLVFFALMTFFVFFPAVWVEPNMLLKGTLLSKAFESTWPIFAGFIAFILIDMLLVKSRITGWILDKISLYKNSLMRIGIAIFLLMMTFVLLNVYSGMKFYDFESIVASPKAGASAGFVLSSFIGRILADAYSLVFGLTPWVLFFLLFGALNSSRNKSSGLENKIIFYFIIFIIFYYIASTVNYVTATVRYQILLYPLASIIAAIGLYGLINVDKIKRYASFPLATVILIIFSSLGLYSIKPFYLAYASDLLPKQYVLNLKGMGDGSFEAAEYLNSLPEPEKLSIWSDKGAVCESFRGRCITGFNKKDVIGVPFDFFVASADRKKRSLSMSRPLKNYFDFEKLFTTDQGSVYDLKIGGRGNNFVRITGAQDIIISN